MNHDHKHMNHNHEETEKNGMVVYACPMHPEIKQDEPGICSECGMNLVPMKNRKKDHANHDYDKHAGHSTEMFFRKFWICLIFTIPVVLYSEVAEKFLGITLPHFVGYGYLPLVLGSFVFFYGGIVFISGAWRELRAKLPGMMTLIALAISAAYIWSVYATFAD